MRLIYGLPILKGLSATFHDVSYVGHDFGRIQIPKGLEFTGFFFHRSQDNGLFGIAQNGKIWIVRRHNNLTPEFYGRQNIYDDLPNKPVVQIVLRLVYE